MDYTPDWARVDRRFHLEANAERRVHRGTTLFGTPQMGEGDRRLHPALYTDCVERAVESLEAPVVSGLREARRRCSAAGGKAARKSRANRR